MGSELAATVQVLAKCRQSGVGRCTEEFSSIWVSLLQMSPLTIFPATCLSSLQNTCMFIPALLFPQPHLAVGSNDYYISVYSVEKRIR